LDQTETKIGESWAIVELMGHVRLAGRITEAECFGAKMGRLDIPQDDGAFVTQYFSGSSVYRITLVTEAVARHVSKNSSVAPVQPWDFPKSLPSADVAIHEDDQEEDDVL
jgi:hypothetical protein